MFDSIARHGFDDIALKFLRAKVGHGFGECVGKSASKHNDELHVSISVLVGGCERDASRLWCALNTANSEYMGNIRQYLGCPQAHIHAVAMATVSAAVAMAL